MIFYYKFYGKQHIIYQHISSHPTLSSYVLDIGIISRLAFPFSLAIYLAEPSLEAVGEALAHA